MNTHDTNYTNYYAKKLMLGALDRDRDKNLQENEDPSAGQPKTILNIVINTPLFTIIR